MLYINTLLLIKKMESKINKSVTNFNRSVFEDTTTNVCNSSSILDDSLICCNDTICDKYCYKDRCLLQKRVWFCFDPIGVLAFYGIKFSVSIIIFILNVIAGIYWKDFNQIRLSLVVLILDLMINCLLILSLRFDYCGIATRRIVAIPLYIFSYFVAFLIVSFDNDEPKDRS